MSFLLNIDTAVQSASVCLARDGWPLGFRSNPQQQDHASWLHVAINELLQEQGLQADALRAVAVSAGPGSYTGLRVGLSAAKGLCYALRIPLIAINTLELMVASVDAGDAELLCPMIDARRMEVFTAVFDRQLQTVMATGAKLLDESSFEELRARHRMLFFGNGAPKFERVMKGSPAAFASVEATSRNMAPMAQEKFNKSVFVDLAYAEPFYGKDFHSLV